MNKDMKILIQKGLKFISEEQQKDGVFLSLSSPVFDNFERAKKYNSTFPTSLILLALSDINFKDFNDNQDFILKAVDFLIKQKSEHWSFNYWSRDAKENKTLPYPDDLDDTFCALSAIWKYRPKIIDGEALAEIVNILTFTEKEEGGPYKTWLVPSDAKEVWKDIDLAVNSNVAYFLSLQEISLPKIKKFIEEKIEKEDYTSPYYPSIYPVIYFISRFYKGNKKTKIINFLLKKQKEDGSWGNPLNTALSISALLNLKTNKNNLERSINYILENNKDGKWNAYAFCIDPAIDNTTYYAGSPALTTALCIEALDKYQKTLKNDNKKGTVDNRQVKIHKKIIKKAKERFSILDKELNSQATDILARILKTDKDSQITLLPFFFASSLDEVGKKIPDEFLIKLGLANLYGWIAYTIYDDFLDEEGDPKRLSVANICLRELTDILNDILPRQTGFYDFFQKTMDKIDSANTWETSNCRGIDLQNIPDYGNYERLAERSMGHVLGPIAILFYLDYSESSPEVRHTIEFFENYIIAKQLNDDAHDWETDLKNQHVSPACVMILKKWKLNREINITDDIETLRSIFWNKVILEICGDAIKHIKKAEQSIDKINIIKNKKIFKEILNSLKRSSDKAIEEQKKTLQFLRNYK